MTLATAQACAPSRRSSNGVRPSPDYSGTTPRIGGPPPHPAPREPATGAGPCDGTARLSRSRPPTRRPRRRARRPERQPQTQVRLGHWSDRYQRVTALDVQQLTGHQVLESVLRYVRRVHPRRRMRDRSPTPTPVIRLPGRLTTCSRSRPGRNLTSGLGPGPVLGTRRAGRAATGCGRRRARRPGPWRRRRRQRTDSASSSVRSMTTFPARTPLSACGQLTETTPSRAPARGRPCAIPGRARTRPSRTILLPLRTQAAARGWSRPCWRSHVSTSRSSTSRDWCRNPARGAAAPDRVDQAWWSEGDESSPPCTR